MSALATFRSNLRAKLKAAGINQLIFAERVGASASGISRMLSGATQIDMDRAEAWADALDLSGEARNAFLDQMAVAAANQRAQAVVAKQQDEIAHWQRIAIKCKSSIERIRKILHEADDP